MSSLSGVDRHRMMEEKLVGSVSKKLGIPNWRCAPDDLRHYLFSEVRAMISNGRMTSKDVDNLARNARNSWKPEKLHQNIVAHAPTPPPRLDPLAQSGSSPCMPEDRRTSMPSQHRQLHVPALPQYNVITGAPVLVSSPRGVHIPGHGAAPKFVKPRDEHHAESCVEQREMLEQQLKEKEQARLRRQEQLAREADEIESSVTSFQREENRKKQERQQRMRQLREEQDKQFQAVKSYREEEERRRREEDDKILKMIEEQSEQKSREEVAKKLKSIEQVRKVMHETEESQKIRKMEAARRAEEQRQILEEAIRREAELEQKRNETRMKATKRLEQTAAKQERIYHEMSEMQKELEQKQRHIEEVTQEKLKKHEADIDTDMARRRTEQQRRRDELARGLEVQMKEHDYNKKISEEAVRREREAVARQLAEQEAAEQQLLEARRQKKEEFHHALKDQIVFNVQKKAPIAPKISSTRPW